MPPCSPRIGAATRGLTRAPAARSAVAATSAPPAPLVNKTRRARAGSECMAAHASESTAGTEWTTRRGPGRQTPPCSPRDRSRHARVDARARRPARGVADACPARTSREQDAAGARRTGVPGGARDGARPRARSGRPGEAQEGRRHRTHRGIGAATRELTRAPAGRPAVAAKSPPPVPLVNKTRRARAGPECMAAHATESTARTESTTRGGPGRQTPPHSPRDRSRHARVDARARRPVRSGGDVGPARTSREQDAAGARRIGVHGGARDGVDRGHGVDDQARPKKEDATALTGGSEPPREG